MTASTKKAQEGAQGKRYDATSEVAEALHALYNAGAFDFINNMFGRTVGEVSAHLGIAPPAKFGDPRERPTVEDFAAWLDRIPPTFDPLDGQGKTRGRRSPEALLVVTPNEAAGLIEQVRDADLYDSDEGVAAFLLLIHSIVFTDDPTRRWMYLQAAERVLLIYTFYFDEAGDKLREEAARGLKKRGSQ